MEINNLLAEGESVFLKSVVPCKSSILKWKSTHPRIYSEFELQGFFFLKKLRHKSEGEGGKGDRSEKGRGMCQHDQHTWYEILREHVRIVIKRH